MQALYCRPDNHSVAGIPAGRRPGSGPAAGLSGILTTRQTGVFRHMANVSVNDIAKFCRISPRRVQQLVKEGMPSEGRGQYNLAACAQWYIGYLQDKLKETGSGSSTTELKERRSRYLEIQATSAELDLRKKIGTLIDSEHAHFVMQEAMVIIATQMDGLGGRMASELAVINDPAEIRNRLLNETRRIRAAAADRLSSMAATGDSIIDPDTPAAKKPGRVGKRKSNTATRKRRAGAVEK